jgi:hypothetical protein
MLEKETDILATPYEATDLSRRKLVADSSLRSTPGTRS